ncbi:MAG TPA: regulatory protein RecX [Solirubrobacterales bacterium]|nr:regulatory protein RecX [Solirubrobacterales bacterium]
MSDEALELALRALGRRERSSAELRSWLADREVADDEADAVVAHLEGIGQLDDARFARRYAEDKRELAGWGAERIREALLARGVAPEHIEPAVAADGPAEELERAAALLVRRAEPLESERERARALGYLTRRGYSYEIAHEALRAYDREST